MTAPMPDIPEEAVQAAEVVEKALREHLRLRLGKRALTDAMLEKPIMLSGREAEDAARIAVDALTGAGMAVAAACACGHPISACHSCGQARCYYCDPGLGKHYQPMQCNQRHEPAALPERTTDTDACATWYAWCFSHGRLHHFTPSSEYPDGAWCTAHWSRLNGTSEDEALADKSARYGDTQFLDALPLDVQVAVIDETRPRRG